MTPHVAPISRPGRHGRPPGDSDRAGVADSGRHVPVIAVTGTNGKTTTTRLISHLMQADGRIPGLSSTDGIVIDGV